MAISFRPVDGSFFELLTQMAVKLQEGADLLAEVLDDGADREAIAEHLAEAETSADELVHQFVSKVNRTFVTPIDREDLYALAHELDEVMDHMDSACDLIWLYEVEELPKEFAKQVTVLQRCSELTAEAMPRLRGRKDLHEYWEEISRLESAGDKQYRRILAKLFDGRYDPLEVVKLKDIISSMEAAIDAFERVATTVEQIVVKES